MSYYWGVDPGYRSFAIAVLDDRADLVAILQSRYKGDNHDERLVEIGMFLERVTSVYYPSYVVHEGQSFGSPHRGRTLQVHIEGVCMLFYANRNILYNLIAPTSAKKAFTGNGHAKKDEVARVVEEKIGILFPESLYDMSDAFMMAYISWQSEGEK